MTEWLFVFLFVGQVHATGTVLTEEECRLMLDTASVEVVACVNINRPRVRIYRTKKP